MKIKTYMSDPEWSSSFIGKYLYIYRSKGTLEWDGDTMVYTDRKRRIDIQKNSIKKLGVGNYSRAAKPIKLDYIEIIYENENLQKETLYFTPIVPDSNPWFTPVWVTDKYLKKCLEEMKNWSHS